MTLERKRINDKYYILITIVVVLVLLSTHSIYYQSRIENEGVYVIGDVLSIKKLAKGGCSLKYTFIYKGKKHYSSNGISEKKDEFIGRRYIVKILPEKPGISRILYNKRITCDTLTAPYNGWKEIPSHFPFFQDHEGNMYISYPCVFYDSNYLERINEEFDIPFNSRK